MTSIKEKQFNIYSRKTIRSALKSLDNLEKLGEHSLARLKIVELKRRETGLINYYVEAGRALHHFLIKAIENLRFNKGEPNYQKKEWWEYIILRDRYIWGRSRADLLPNLYCSETTYHRAFDAGTDKVAQSLHQWEIECDDFVSPPSIISLVPPRPPYKLVGRDNQLDELKRNLFSSGDVALFALHGLPGVGKTALAIELANDPVVQIHFSDGLLWAPFGRQPDILGILDKWSAALGVQEEKLAKSETLIERIKLIHEEIGSRRMLIIIDDAWDSESALLFRTGTNCSRIITTRLADVAVHFASNRFYQVSELPENDGLALLEQLAPRIVKNAKEEASTLVKAVGGLPLALILAGNYLHIRQLNTPQFKASSLIKELLENAEKRMQLSQPQSPLEHQPSLPEYAWVSLDTIIGISDDALDKTSRNVLKALSVFAPKPNTFSKEAALQVSNSSSKTFLKLINHGLVETTRNDRFSLHQTVSDYFHNQLISENGIPKIISHLATYYLNLIKSAGRNWQIVEAELTQIRHTWGELKKINNPQLILDFVNSMENFQIRRGMWRERIDWCQQTLDVARLSQSSFDEAKILNSIGWSYRELGETHVSLENLHLALSIRQTINDQSGKAETLNNIGIIHDDLGEGSKALEYYEQALAIYRELGEHKDEAKILNNIGIVLFYMGRFKESLEYYEMSLSIFREVVDDSYGKAQVFNEIGCIYASIGELKKALEFLEQALHLNRELGELQMMATVLNTIGAVYRNLGDFNKAIQYYTQSRNLCQKINSQTKKAVAIHNIAVAYLDLGKPEKALELLDEALPMRRAIGDRNGEAYTLTAYGKAYKQLDMLDKACLFTLQSLDVWREISSQNGEVTGLINLGAIYLAQCDFALAHSTFVRALELSKKAGMKIEFGDAKFGLGQVEAAHGNTSQAQKLGQESLAIYLDVGNQAKSDIVEEWLNQLKS